MFNMYGQFDMRSMSGVSHKPLSQHSAIAKAATQGHHRDAAKNVSAIDARAQKYQHLRDKGLIDEREYQTLMAGLRL